MLDSPLTLILLGISAASAIASFTAARRRRTRSTPPALSTLTDADLLAALAALEPHATSASSTAQPRASRQATDVISAMHAASRMREVDHPKSVSGAIEQGHDVRRRLTLLIIEEIERRQVRTER
jgi:hypothetical protein